MFHHYKVKRSIGYLGEHSFLPSVGDGRLYSQEMKGIDPVRFELDCSGKVIGVFYKADEVANPIKFIKK